MRTFKVRIVLYYSCRMQNVIILNSKYLTVTWLLTIPHNSGTHTGHKWMASPESKFNNNIWWSAHLVWPQSQSLLAVVTVHSRVRLQHGQLDCLSAGASSPRLSLLIMSSLSVSSPVVSTVPQLSSDLLLAQITHNVRIVNCGDTTNTLLQLLNNVHPCTADCCSQCRAAVNYYWSDESVQSRTIKYLSECRSGWPHDPDLDQHIVSTTKLVMHCLVLLLDTSTRMCSPVHCSCSHCTVYDTSSR